jgi:thiamine-phosphate pyrophosphorylase
MHLASIDRVPAPRITLITATDVVPETVLFERLSGLAAYSAERRAQFAVQLRDLHLSGRALSTFGVRLREAVRALGAMFIVNDRLDVAAALRADGIHLGRSSVQIEDARAFLGPRAFISVACHTVEEVAVAAQKRADAALLSPIFFSPGKGPPLGPAALTEAKDLLQAGGYAPLWLIALGGVNSQNAPRCIDAGADGIALIRSPLDPPLLSLLQS